MPLLYQPKFCCNCGEKIDRLDWQPWTSRRFCGVCESEQKHHDLLPRIVVGIGLFAGLFGISGYMRKSESPPVTRLAAAANKRSDQPASGATAAKLADKSPALPPAANSAANGSGAARDVPVTAIRQVPGARATEAVYYCGATTKKGTMCSRRVRSAGRCWQHKGQPSGGDEAPSGH